MSICIYFIESSENVELIKHLLSNKSHLRYANNFIKEWEMNNWLI